MKRVGISDPFSERERKAAAVEKSVFAARLDHCYNELKWLYCELYHNDRGAFDYFVQMLEAQQTATICRKAPKGIFLTFMATPHNCVCGRMAGLFPHPHSLENRKYTKYSSVFQTFG